MSCADCLVDCCQPCRERAEATCCECGEGALGLTAVGNAVGGGGGGGKRDAKSHGIWCSTASRHYTCRTCLDKQAADEPGRRGRWYQLACQACCSAGDVDGGIFPDAAVAELFEDPSDLFYEHDGKTLTVDPGTLEWAFVQQVFYGPRPRGGVETGPDYMHNFARTRKIVTVQKVVNEALFGGYVRYREWVADRNLVDGARDANELWLKHGTNTTDPAIIWESKVRFCLLGPLGLAIP